MQKLNRPRVLLTKRSAKRSAHVHQLSFVVVIVVVVIVVVIIVVVVIVVVITAKDFLNVSFYEVFEDISLYKKNKMTFIIDIMSSFILT